MDTRLYSITISHQIGSGGAYLGKKLSERLGILFLDRDILKEVARQLDLAENELEDRKERLSTFWQNFARLAILTDPYMSIEKQCYIGQKKCHIQALFTGCAANLKRTARWLAGERPQIRHKGVGL